MFNNNNSIPSKSWNSNSYSDKIEVFFSIRIKGYNS